VDEEESRHREEVGMAETQNALQLHKQGKINIESSAIYVLDT
jgi:hypothetical protein